MRAFYHTINFSGDRHEATSHDSISRPVSIEILNALKYRVYPKHDESQSLVDRFKMISQELEFPWECEILRFDITESDMEVGVKEMVDYYTRERVIEPYDILWMFIHGSAYLDIEEPWTQSIIRVAIREGESVLIPAGAYRRYTLDVHHGCDIRMWGMYKTSDTSVLEADLPPLIFGEEAERHQTRKVYLESIRT